MTKVRKDKDGIKRIGRIIVERPVCKCGGYAILGNKCADCFKKGKRNGD